MRAGESHRPAWFAASAALVATTAALLASPVLAGPSSDHHRAPDHQRPKPGCAHGFPRPGCTGLPKGTEFERVIHGSYTVDRPRTIDRWRITGDLLVEADGVRITNSEIGASVINDTDDGRIHSYVIRNSTVGPRKCGRNVTFPMGVGFARFRAINVKVRGHEDGFRAAGPRILIRDSYYSPCVDPESHADGVQDYPASRKLVIDHNTFDQSKLRRGFTAPIFITSDGTRDVTITDNLVLGGVYSLFIDPLHGRWNVSGNRIARGTWTYAPIDHNGDCRGKWSDNRVARVSKSYELSKVGKPEPCD